MYQHLDAFQSWLRENKAAAALLRLPENLVLFTQYWPRYGFAFLFVPASGEPVVICPMVELEDTKEVGITNAIGFGDVLLSDGDPIQNVVNVIHELAARYQLGVHPKIAIEGGEDVMAPTFVANKVQLCGSTTRNILKQGFDTDDFIYVKDAIRDIRSIKNESDLEKLELVNEVLQKALDYFETLLQTPGIREVDVLAETQAYYTKLACGYRGARGAARPFGQLSTGPERSLVAWADGILSCGRVLQDGDVAMYEIGACMDGYWADLTRTGCVGGFRGEKKQAYDAVSGAFQAGLAMAKDGVRGAEVDAACRAYLEERGYGQYFVHPAGHGTGFAHSEGFPHLEPGSQDVLREGMVIAIEPGVYIPGIGGIRVENNVVVGKTGGYVLGLHR